MNQTIMDSILTTQSIGIACGVGFIAYCIYFDHRRRNAPDYKDKVRARRAEEKKKQESEDDIEIPDIRDKASVEKFFLQELQIGEELLEAGQMERAIKHLSLAIVVCSQPQAVLTYFKESLPPTAYKLLLERLPIANETIIRSARKSESGGIMEDEEVE